MFILTQQSNVGLHFMAQLRDKEIQQDSFRFRTNLERIGELLAYEVSKELSYEKATVSTSLGQHHTQLIADPLVIATVLRAGLPMFQGVMKLFDWAESAFIGAYRTESENAPIQVNLGYVATPTLTDKTLIMADPMLATGKSLVKAYEALLAYGKPKKVHILSAIASKPGVDYIAEQLPECKLWLGDLDETLNQQAYIVPGLGDAGDLSFGTKN